ncbi:host cell division inhibitor Icd-like protein [Escherichia coli]|nr:host cell division inhibitor Icd-like protein [Escherichia coli]MBE9944061.1 host cell division inhibitor Icd-like protein [Escherichia coli]MBF0047664.1 host cell division inhibitor Icd-like protein [Escherichia coli]
MNTGYAPVQGRGFVRPGETEKPQNWCFSGIKKAAPIMSRLSEQLTCCEKNGSVQGNYINRVTKRHNCRITGKTKATAKGRQWVLRQIKLERIANNATFAAGGQCDQCAGLLVGYSCSLALRRWRRLISPSNAAVTNCPVLSPSSLTLSMASTIWSGTRASILFDFAFTDFVAISDFRLVWCPTMIARKKFNAMLDVSHTDKITCVRHLIFISHKMTKPRTVGAVTGLLTTNDNESIEVAMRNHTTHPQGRDSHNLNKYIWRFIALSTAQPRVITIEATSEQEARQQSPAGCVMVFAARIRQGVHHVQ